MFALPKFQMPNQEDDHDQMDMQVHEQSNDVQPLVDLDTITVNFKSLIHGIEGLQESVLQATNFAKESFSSYDEHYDIGQQVIVDMQKKLKSQAKLLQ